MRIKFWLSFFWFTRIWKIFEPQNKILKGNSSSVADWDGTDFALDVKKNLIEHAVLMLGLATSALSFVAGTSLSDLAKEAKRKRRYCLEDRWDLLKGLLVMEVNEYNQQVLFFFFLNMWRHVEKFFCMVISLICSLLVSGQLTRLPGSINGHTVIKGKFCMRLKKIIKYYKKLLLHVGKKVILQKYFFINKLKDKLLMIILKN